VSKPLRLACSDVHAPPLFEHCDGRQDRLGFEPDVGRLVATALDQGLEWVFRPWADLIPTVQRGAADGVFCGQGITNARLEVADFTRPYAVFDEAVMVRADSTIQSVEDLAGRRVGAIAGSTNMALAETFHGAVCVPFDGTSDDVFADMIAAVRAGAVDAFVDDDVALAPLASEADLRIAFTHPTRNRWGIAVSKNAGDTLAAIDGALAATIANGRHRAIWERWLPTLAYPFEDL
jgi:polar amino acid transport system substrate-binding protein